MNDTSTSGFCQCAECRKLDPTDPAQQKTPRGLPNYSNRFFTFVNRVAEELARSHPDKYLGCLAYHVTEPPPTFKVHPRVIPVSHGGPGELDRSGHPRGRSEADPPVVRQGAGGGHLRLLLRLGLHLAADLHEPDRGKA